MTDTTFVTLRAELGKLRADLKTARAEIDKLTASKSVKLTIDQAKVDRDAAKTIRSVQAAFRKKPIRLSIDRDQVNRLFARPVRVRAKVDVDRSSLTGLTSAQRVKLRIDHNAWRFEIASARYELRELTGTPQTVRVNATGDFKTLRAELRRLKKEVDGVGNSRVRGGGNVHSGGGGGSNVGFFGGSGGRFAVGAGVAGVFGGGRATMVGGGLGAAVGGVGGAVLGAGVGMGVDATAGFVGSGVAQNAELASIKIQLDRLLESSDKADDLIESLKEIDLQLPVDFTTVSRAAQQLAAAGFDAAQIPKDLLPILDAAAMSNVGTEEGTNRIIRAITQIRSKGKLQAEEVMQLQELGLPAREIISEQFGGRNFDEIAKASQAGEIPIDEVLDKLIAGFGDRFGGVLEMQSETLAGQMDMLADKFKVLQRTAAEPIMEPLHNAMQSFIDAIDTGKLDALAEAMGEMALASVKATEAIAVQASSMIKAYKDYYSRVFDEPFNDSEDDGKSAFGQLLKSAVDQNAAANDAPITPDMLPSPSLRSGGLFSEADTYDPADIKDTRTREYVETTKEKILAGEPVTQQEASDYLAYSRTGAYPVNPPVTAEEQAASDAMIKASEEAGRKAQEAQQAAETAKLDAEFGGQSPTTIDEFELGGRVEKPAPVEKTEQDRQQDYFDSLGSPTTPAEIMAAGASPEGYESFKAKQIAEEEKRRADNELGTIDTRNAAVEDAAEIPDKLPDMVTPIIEESVNESLATATGVDASKYDLDSDDEETRRSETRRYEDDVKFAKSEALFNANRIESDEEFERVKFELPAAAKDMIGQRKRVDPILAKMLEGTTANIEQVINADGTARNRVSLNRPDLQRGPSMQASGVADINRLVQANVERAQERRLQEKANETLAEINKGIQEIAEPIKNTSRNTKGQVATVGVG